MNGYVSVVSVRIILGENLKGSKIVFLRSPIITLRFCMYYEQKKKKIEPHKKYFLTTCVTQGLGAEGPPKLCVNLIAHCTVSGSRFTLRVSCYIYLFFDRVDTDYMSLFT